MRKVVSVLLVCLLLVMQLPIGAGAETGAAIPTDGLDLWLEADYGVVTDDAGAVTAWTSKVNGLEKDAPYVLDQLSTLNDAGYTAPTVRQSSTGKPVVYFNGKWLATEDFTAYANNDEATMFLLTKPVRETDRNEVSYLVQHGSDKNGVYINRTKDGVYEAKDGTGKGHAFKTSPTDYAVLMVMGQKSKEGGKEFLLSVNNDNKRNGGINGQLGMTRYRLGHRADDEVAACLVYQRTLSDAEQTQVYEYLYNKYIAAPVYPTMQSASINAAGDSITLTADSALSGSCDAADFQVTAGGEAAVVSAAEVNAAGGVTLTLSAAVPYGKAVSVSYTGTGLVNAAGNAMAAFSDYTVDVSAIPVPAGQKPVIVSADIGIRGVQVQLTADLALSGSPAASEFQVTGTQSGNVAVQAVTVSGKDILLTLSAPLGYGETAKISYTGSSVVSTDNGVMDVFSNQEAQPYTLERIPTGGLDLWLEADAGVAADDKGAVTAWTSKINALGKNAPYVLDQLSTVNDAGYTAPTVRQSPTGEPVVYFNGKSLSTTSFEPYQGSGEMTLFLLTRYAKGNDARSNVSYLVQNGEEKDKNGFYLNRKNDGQYEIKDGGGVGHAFANIPDGYTILTVTAKREDGQRYFYLHQNGVQEKRVAFNNSIDMTRYRLGHRADDEVAACLVYQRAVSDMERESVCQYLYEKYVMESPFAVRQVSAKTTADGYAEVSGKAVNTAIAAVPSARVMCASYDGTVMKDIGVFDLTDCTLGREQEFLLRVKLPENQKNASVRLFLWDGFEMVRPLMKNQPVTISNQAE